MAVFFDNAITDAGRQLWAEIQAGGVFTPTKIVIGSGYMPTGKTTRTMTAVAEPVKNLTLNKKRALTSGDFVFGGMFSNSDISTAFYFRELALYAKVVRTDQTETAETLYSYGNAGANAELIPAYSAGTAVERQLDIISYIGNDATVNLTITSGIYITRDEGAITDKDVLPSGTILAWANGCNVNTTKFVRVSTHAPSDLPIKTSGWLEVICTESYKKVRFTPYGNINGLVFTRDISSNAWAYAWDTSPATGTIAVYLDATNGNDTNSGLSIDAPLQTLSKAITNFRGARSIELHFKAGTYGDGSRQLFSSFSSVALIREGTGTVTINGGVVFHGCAFAQVSNITINASSYAGRALNVLGGTAVFQSVSVITDGSNDNIVFDACHALMTDSTITGGKIAVTAWGSTVGLSAVKIASANTGIYANSSHIIAALVTNGATLKTHTDRGGIISE